MLNALKFVQGAVSTKDFVPQLKHFHISKGRILGYNGHMCLSSPLALDIDCCPHAETFVRAIGACGEEIQVSLTPAGRLSVKSGKFRALIDNMPGDAFPFPEPAGDSVAIDANFIAALRLLYEFTAEDASRPWAAGVLLKGNSAFATNNIIALEHWLATPFPFCVNLPRPAIKELLRIREVPKRALVAGNAVTFFYEGDRWLYTQLNSADWPDVGYLLDKLPPRRDCPELPAELWPALETLAPFSDKIGEVLFGNGAATVVNEGQPCASVEIDALQARARFNLRMVQLLAPVATHARFDCWPATVPFYGPAVRGALVGLRDA